MSNELVPVGKWLPEASEVIDDVIEDLCTGVSTKAKLREVITNRPMYPEGEGLGQDIGYIQCEPARELLVTLIHAMIKTAPIFHGLIYRDKAALTTVLIGFGLPKIESMLTRRRERIMREWKDLLNGKTHYSIENYRFKRLKAAEKGNPYYRYNYTLLDSSVSGRINEIKREYNLGRGFQAEMSVVEALRTSRLFPEEIINELNKEHEEFEQWVKIKTNLDLAQD